MTTQTRIGYVQPADAGLASEARAVGRRIGKLLDSLDTINSWVVMGDIENDCRKFKNELIDNLKADGWRVSVKANNRYQVLPPAK